MSFALYAIHKQSYLGLRHFTVKRDWWDCIEGDSIITLILMRQKRNNLVLYTI